MAHTAPSHDVSAVKDIEVRWKSVNSIYSNLPNFSLFKYDLIWHRVLYDFYNV